MKKLLPIILLLGCLVLPQYSTEWSEDILIAEAEDNDDFDYEHLVLDNDGNYVVTSVYWDNSAWDHEIDYLRFSQDGTILVEPIAVIDSPTDDEGNLNHVVDSHGLVHIFSYTKVASNRNDIYYCKLDLEGNVIQGSEPFIDTYADIMAHTRPAIAIEPDDTIHLLYLDNPYNDTGEMQIGYTRWNPYTGERFDITGLIPNDPRIDGYHHAGEGTSYSIAIDSEGTAHCLIGALFYYELYGQGAANSEIYWMRVGDFGDLPTGKVLTRFELASSSEDRPYATIDDNDVIHVVYTGDPHTDYDIAWNQCCYLSIDTDGNTVTPLRYDFFPEEWEDGNDKFAMHYNNGSLALIEKNGDLAPGAGVSAAIFGRLDLQGNVLEEFEIIVDEHVIGSHSFPEFVHHNNGFIGYLWSDCDYPDYENVGLYYKYTLAGAGVDSTKLTARSTEEGLLLTWRSGKPDSTWRLTRDDEQLASLSGRSDYAYLDTTAKPNTTYSFRLVAEFPDGDRQQFAPVEATWQPPAENRLSLEAPYPCPAEDSVTLSYSLPTDTTVAELAIYDLASRLLEQIILNPQVTDGVLSLPTDEYIPGLYIIRLSTATDALSSRFVIAR